MTDVTETVEELWADIPGFPNYKVSSFGRIYNISRDHIMSVSETTYGHAKISLVNEEGDRVTRSIALLVAEAFVPGKDILFDNVVVLDGDLSNVCADNLVWRPRWFAWKYSRQLHTQQPVHYKNLPVVDLTTDILYDSVIHAGMSLGLLFGSIWRSTYTGHTVYPTDSMFEIDKRV